MLAVFFEEEVLELVFFLVIIRQTVASADPYTPLAVGHNNAGDVVGDAVGVVFIVLIYGKRVSVVLVDAVVGGEPHIAELVLRYGEDRALGQTVVNGYIRKVYLSPSFRISVRDSRYT